MAEGKKIATGYIGNALRSSAADHTTTFADEVFDTERQKYQSEVNTDIESKIEEEAEARELAITAEAQARSQNDQLLSQAIAAEQERAEAAEQANATSIIGTDRIEDGSVTSEKINSSAFDSTLSVSGKIAPADVVGEKLTKLDSIISKESVIDKDDVLELATDDEITITSIIGETITSEEECQSWNSDDYDEKGQGEQYAKITPKGIYAKGYFDIEGKPLIQNGKFIGKRVLFFGDSLVAASTSQNTNGGFVKLIAERNGCKYKRYYNVKNPTEQDKLDVCFKNISRDGLPIRHRDDLSYGSIYERVMNWVAPETCDLVVLQGGTNDGHSTETWGTFNEGDYTSEYDIYKTIGAFENMLRYCTNNGIKVCFIITHQVSGQSSNYYEDLLKACEKWGVPYLDLRKKAGFYIDHKNPAHGIKYTIYSNEEWSPTKTYTLDAKVRYEGKSYKCRVDSCVGIAPSNEEYWQKTSDYDHDFSHLNNLGHEVISYKIEEFIKSI